ncbi:hypothetical protein [Hanstruepera marina]|uniref:hypothetical protein n=1 Tax=Hanstruepera marina TaxID=2873265 RepID=UPI001CA6FA05|nr:hypothetical protein [Hanstruepera marina]
MKYFKPFTILLLALSFSTLGCKDKTEAPQEASQETELQPLQVFDAPAKQNTTAQNTSGLYHYTCPNGCAGGAAAAGNCSSCGTALAHNQAYHNNTNTNNSPTSTTTNTTAQSGQNAAGVWHYTCSNGCVGGAASAGNCGACGNTLAHNTAYHN